ncbi:hypothetical protein FKM82_027306 [Ascaphus truei]
MYLHPSGDLVSSTEHRAPGEVSPTIYTVASPAPLFLLTMPLPTQPNIRASYPHCPVPLVAYYEDCRDNDSQVSFLYSSTTHSTE